jgi:uncharacterized protein YqeY
MSLTAQVNEAIKTAMKEKNQAALRALRAIKSALLLAQTEKADVVIDTAKELQILQKLAKQRRDSMEIYQAQNRQDLLQIEAEELALIEQFLPAQLDEAEVKLRLMELIKQVGASSPADLGRMMPMAMKAFEGQADNKLISSVLKNLLSGNA